MRHPKYNHSNNPLFSKEEAEYWDNIVLPTDEEYTELMAMTEQMDYHQLYRKIGHNKFIPFIVRMEEDDYDKYIAYYHIPIKDSLPF